MRQCGDILVSESPLELARRLPRGIQLVEGKKHRHYLDITATLDIETSATENRGLIYSYQLNIGGVNCLLRHTEDFLRVLDLVVGFYQVKQNRRIVFYVHNLGFEMYWLSQILLTRYRIRSQLYTKSHKPIQVTLANGIEFRDSLKLFQKSLAAATKGLPHEKRVGDLDYRVWRTPETALTDEEFAYCVYDVQGLWEAIERLKEERGYNAATIPLTNTAMVIDEVNRYIRHDKNTLDAMQAVRLDKTQLTICYQAIGGGDTHGCRWRAGITYENCNSHDKKSAHPSQMLLEKFPMGVPMTVYEYKEKDLENLARNGYGWVGLLFLSDLAILPECPNPPISVSKCAEMIEKGGVDNGRLLSCKAVSVYCDSNDYQRIRDAYTFSGAILSLGVVFKLDYLPQAFRDSVMEKFRYKELNASGADYDFAKICVNTIYGACAQKRVRDEYEITYEDGIEVTRTDWYHKLQRMTEEQVTKTQSMKLPFLWGLWTASLSRLELWKLQKACGWENLIYWDTDSVKYEGLPSQEIENYNESIRRKCQERGCVITKADGKKVYIGIAENEHEGVDYGYQRFRFLHAKCYCGTEWNKKTGIYEFSVTIAGVGKKEGVRALRCEEDLKDGFYIRDAGGNKLHYVSRPVTENKEFSRLNLEASYVWMEPRDYRISDAISVSIEQEILGG